MKKHIPIIIFSLAVVSLVSLASAQSDSPVPAWIKNTAGFWSNDQISDNEFLNAIKFLLENKIIVLEEKITDSTMQKEETVVALTPVSKPRLNYCIILYPTYQDLGQNLFRNKYSHVNYINECIKLYKDPIWSYAGDDRIDKLYVKFLQFIDAAKLERPKLSTDPHVNILSSVNVGTEKYLVKFNVCAGDLPIDKAKILVRSEIESIEIGSSKDIPANACRTYETQLLAKYPANIRASIIEQVLIDETQEN